MKKLLLSFALLISLAVSAQVPQGINYQAVVRDANGNIAASQNATFLMQFLDNADNSIDYSETFNVTSDQFGLVNFALGTGTPTLGTFAGLDWSKQYKISMMVNLGSGYVSLAQQDFYSVPYALNAQHAESVDINLNDITDVDVTGAQSGEVLMFDGTNWIPSSASGGFGLPYLASDPNLVSFGITNTSALGGSAIYGKTTTNSTTANGVRGESTGANGNGVYGKSTGANSNGVLGENTQGYGVKGTTATTSSSGAAVYAVNTGTAGNGVLGVASAPGCNGVQGSSNNGTGVLGYSNNNVGVYGSTIDGIGLKGYSITGYGLESTGKVKIAGGNTNPGAGKVLTSDASGNATWQTPINTATPKVAFSAYGTAVPLLHEHESVVEFNNEVYDYSNSFIPNTGTVTATSGSFIIPYSGIYEFDAFFDHVFFSPTLCFDESPYSNYLTINGVLADGSEVFYGDFIKEQSNTFSTCLLKMSSTYEGHFNAGDRVFVRIYQTNDDQLDLFPMTVSFSGHLIFKD